MGERENKGRGGSLIVLLVILAITYTIMTGKIDINKLLTPQTEKTNEIDIIHPTRGELYTVNNMKGIPIYVTISNYTGEAVKLIVIKPPMESWSVEIVLETHDNYETLVSDNMFIALLRSNKTDVLTIRGFIKYKFDPTINLVKDEYTVTFTVECGTEKKSVSFNIKEGTRI